MSDVFPEVSILDDALPEWVWSPKDDWSRYKGIGRIFIFLAVFVHTIFMIVGTALYGVGLLGMRMQIEEERKEQGNITNE